MDPHEMRNLRFGDKKGGFDGRTSGVSEPAVKSPRPLGTLFKTGAELLRENRNVRVTQDRRLSQLMVGEWQSPRHTYLYRSDGTWTILPEKIDSYQATNGRWRTETAV